MPTFNLPNKITLARLLLSIVLFVLLSLLPAELDDGRRPLALTAFAVFLMIAGTDWLDGYLARRRGEVTVLGRIMDPFVDKVVVCGSFILLTRIHPASDYLPAWVVVIIVAREFFVSSIRGFMESRSISFAATWQGKLKMTIQCIAVGALLFVLGTVPSGRPAPAWLDAVTILAVWGALLSTIHSGLVYLARARNALANEAL